MIVYVVKKINDTEYCGYDIEFITTNKEKANRYIEENNYQWNHWSGTTYDYIFYDIYEVEED